MTIQGTIMTSKTIYQPIKPTYLYIKQHSITKKKYFGKTVSKDPYKYTGSGKVWNRHIKKHGKEHIDTLWVSELYDFHRFYQVHQKNKPRGILQI